MQGTVITITIKTYLEGSTDRRQGGGELYDNLNNYYGV
jgi:hypothetical protein